MKSHPIRDTRDPRPVEADRDLRPLEPSPAVQDAEVAALHRKAMKRYPVVRNHLGK